MTMEYHDYANLFPMLPESELGTLAEDIRKNGLQTPITLHEGKILDGRNRYRACQSVGIEPVTEEYRGDNPLAFVVSHNLHRRHLTGSQRAMVASRLATLKHGANRHSLESPIGDSRIEKQTREESAAALKVGTSSLDRARRVQRDGVPELNDAVENGEVTVGAAYKVADLPHKEQRELVAQGKDAIRDKAREMRQAPKPEALEAPEEDEPEDAATVEDTRPNKRLPKWIPDDADRLWMLARTDLDKILPSDKSRERVLREIIAYAQNRIDTNQ